MPKIYDPKNKPFSPLYIDLRPDDDGEPELALVDGEGTRVAAIGYFSGGGTFVTYHIDPGIAERAGLTLNEKGEIKEV